MNGDIDRLDTHAPSSAYTPPPADRPPLILVAEDDEDSMDIVTTMFQHAGYRVAQATTGLEALAMARELRPALLVLDVAMPTMTGWEVADRVRRDSDEGTRTLPILVLTAHAFAEDRQRARALGCDGYLAKPADVRRVVREAKRILAGEPWGGTGEHDAHD
jgi:two-component system cell cycle response regulator DivK